MIRHGGLVARRLGGVWKGALIEGASGSGKSDLSLRLLAEGFRLVADDRVLVWVSQGRLYGRAPDALAGLIEVRGQGIAQVEPLPFCEVALLVRLGKPERMPEPATEAVLGIEVPALVADPFEASAPAKLGRAIAVFDAAHKRRI